MRATVRFGGTVRPSPKLEGTIVGVISCIVGKLPSCIKSLYLKLVYTTALIEHSRSVSSRSWTSSIHKSLRHRYLHTKRWERGALESGQPVRLTSSLLIPLPLPVNFSPLFQSVFCLFSFKWMIHPKLHFNNLLLLAG